MTWAAVSARGEVDFHVLRVAPDRVFHLVGLSGDGIVHLSTDSGASWTRAGTAGGEAQAMAVDVRGGTKTIYVALADGRLVASTDEVAPSRRGTRASRGGAGTDRSTRMPPSRSAR